MVTKQSHAKHPAQGAREKYFEAVGRRKTAVARVRITKGKGVITVNDKDFKRYFVLERLRQTANSPLQNLKLEEKFDVTVHVLGGGISAQADAMRHGIARVLVLVEPEFKNRLRHMGFLTRDPRMVERKKYGLKKARRAPQWAKR